MKSKFTIILFLLFCLSQLLAQDFRVLSSDENSIVVEYTPVYSDTQKIMIDGENYFSFVVANTFPDEQKTYGEPENSIRNFNIGLPSEFGNTIQIISSSFNTIRGKIAPVPYPDKSKDFYSAEYKITENYSQGSNPEQVMFGEFGMIRNLQVQKIKILPYLFNRKTGEIKLYNKIVFRVNYSKPAAQFSLLDDEIVEASVINYNTAKNWGLRREKLRKPSDGILATGNWFRFQTPEEGIYRIDRNTLNSIGINPDQVDPRNIKIYNNGGYMLPEAVPDEVPVGLREVAIQVVGESDGKFDESDYILFYGRGINSWEFDAGKQKIVRRKHFFSNENYYYITADDGTGKRIELRQSENSASAFKQDITEAFAFHDEDKINVLSSGRIYFGDTFSSSDKSFTYISSLGNIVAGSKINYNYQFANVSLKSIQLKIYENDNQIYSKYLNGGHRFI